MLESRFNSLLNKVDIVRMKSRWLLLVVITMVAVQSNAQQGYNWTFASSSIDENSGNKYFNSTPALTGSTGTHRLTVMGEGTVTTGVSDNPGLGTSCTSPIPIANYDNYTGFEFLNGPQLIFTTYTIEMTINQAAGSEDKRLIGFYDLGGAEPINDYGIYVTTDGYIEFRTGSSVNITGSPLSANTWYHLAFTRSSSGVISYYKNGVWIGDYTDSENHFMPHSEESHYNIISILKDNSGEESSGKVARIGIYDAALTATAILQNVNKVCEAIPEEVWQTTGNFGTNTTHFIGTKNNQPLIFKTNNTEALRISPTGQIGIGTVNTADVSYKLFVETGIRTRKVKVDVANWPDYVFHQQYKLPSIKEIEEFIQKNKHLPDVPSAKEVEENGLDLGDNQAILLKKIEELTLHLISINKQVEKLTEENEALKKKVDKREKDQNVRESLDDTMN